MRLSRFDISNFKGIQQASFEWDDIVVLIGENNAGKSTVLQALECFLSGFQPKNDLLFCENRTDAEHAIELVGHFDQLSETEMRCPAIRGRMADDKWIVKKRFWCDINDEGQRTWKEQYFSYGIEEVFANWPENDSAWRNFPPEFLDLIPERGPRPNAADKERLRELVRRHRPDLIAAGEPKWIPNPGGGANWKSNANSAIPRFFYVKAVHDVNEESSSKEASTYGKIVNLIVEKQLLRRPEIIDLRRQMEAVLKLFNPDPEHPEAQAEEIRDLEQRINTRLNEVIGGHVAIRTSDVQIEPLLLPNTFLALRDRPDAVETPAGHQGHGLQRTLVMTLLQILAEIQGAPLPAEEGHRIPETQRSVVLAVEEPELYMHPQMERKMRDVLYRLASQPQVQVICTTHSPVFLDIARAHKTVIRVTKGNNRGVSFFQVRDDIFAGADARPERERLELIARFNPTVNELFFAKRVTLLEEYSSVVALERAGELTGLFNRHAGLRRDVAFIDCRGKGNIPAFQRVLNQFQIPYTVVHDEDGGNALEEANNVHIGALLITPQRQNSRYIIGPRNLEGLLNYAANKDKPYRALRAVDEMYAAGNLPEAFLEAVNWAYFGQPNEPV